MTIEELAKDFSRKVSNANALYEIMTQKEQEMNNLHTELRDANRSAEDAKKLLIKAALELRQ